MVASAPLKRKGTRFVRTALLLLCQACSSGSLLFSASLTFLGLRAPRMLAGEAGLKVFDLLLDFLVAFAGLKEDVVRVSALPMEFVAMAFSVVLVVLFIALQQAGEFVIGSTAGQFHVGFMLAEIVIAEEPSSVSRFSAVSVKSKPR
jgi:hypothetical protein